MLLITYDEHGGFYDHVPPVAVTPVSGTSFPIKQDLKYRPGSLAPRSPDLQRWKLAGSTVLALHNPWQVASLLAPLADPVNTQQPGAGSGFRLQGHGLCRQRSRRPPFRLGLSH